MKAFTVSVTVILLVEVAILYWGFRELTRVLNMTP